MTGRRLLSPFLAFVFAILLAAVCASAQPQQQDQQTQPVPATPPAASNNNAANGLGPLANLLDAITTENLTAAIAWIESPEAAHIPESVRTGERGVLQLLQQALDQRTRANASEAGIREHDAAIAEAPARVAALDAELAQPISPAEINIPENATVAQIEQSLAQARAALDAARAEVERLALVRSTREQRRAEIPVQITAARSNLEEINRELELPRADGEHPAITIARRAMLLTQREALQNRITEIERELQRYDTRREVLSKQRELANRTLSRQEELVQKWQAAVGDARTAEAERSAREAERLEREAAQFIQSLPALKRLTEEVTKLTTRQNDISENLRKAEQRAQFVTEKMQRIRDEYDSIVDRIARVGLTDYVSASLRSSLRGLPDLATLRRQAFVKRGDLSRSELDVIEFSERRNALRDTRVTISELLETLPPDMPEWQRDRVEQIVRESVELRRDLLDDLQDLATDYRDRIGELSEQERNLLLLADDYRSFIEERVLWVRSVPGGRFIHPVEVYQGLRWLFTTPEWRQVPHALLAEIIDRPVLVLLGVIVAGGLILSARRARSALNDSAAKVANWRTDSFRTTLIATLATFVLTLPYPVILIFLGRLLTEAGIDLGRAQEEIHVAEAAGSALMPVAAILLVVLVIWNIARPKGLAEVHFRWQRNGLNLVRRHLAWLTPSILPLVFIVAAMRRQNVDAYLESPGRLAFILAMVLLSVFVFRVFHPHGALMSEFFRRHDRDWIARSRWAIFGVIVAMPLFSATLALLGFFYTALRLEERIQVSAWIIIGFIILNALLLRWLFLARRRLAIEKATRTREAASAEQKPQTEANEAGITVEEAQVDIPALDEQTRRLFRAIVLIGALLSLYTVWADALPALRMLQMVQVYPSFQITEYQQPVQRTVSPIDVAMSPPLAAQPGVMTGVGTAPSGELVAPAEPNVVTLAHLGLAIIVVIVVTLAARNVPGLLEFALLSRLPLDNGSKYAITTIVRYIIVIVGTVLAFGAINIGWSQVQWLAAALTFGLAFGLQEIFANFVSGLIILIERPIRVGDVVTIGDISGKVTRIQMRSTTVTDWERKELIIPNKSFITDRVVNWTLSDQVTRISVNVGIAYGSDTVLAEQLLYRAAGEQENVMKDPAPRVVFLGFGDNSLNFVVHCFVPALEFRLKTIHDMHMAIDKIFREAKISIAFPQRDV
ncbi:MAG: hypothetical protein EA380_07525, partial [Phycisphaeraceae bacterium]